MFYCNWFIRSMGSWPVRLTFQSTQRMIRLQQNSLGSHQLPHLLFTKKKKRAMLPVKYSVLGNR